MTLDEMEKKAAECFSEEGPATDRDFRVMAETYFLKLLAVARAAKVALEDLDGVERYVTGHEIQGAVKLRLALAALEAPP